MKRCKIMCAEGGTMVANSRRLVQILLVVTAALCILAAGPGLCQDDNALPPSVISIENDYLGVSIGRYGKYGDELYVGGRFQLYTTGGDPTNIQDDNQTLNYGMGPMAKFGAFQVMVDGTSTSEGNQPAWAIFERGGTSAIMGDIKDGSWDVLPYTPISQPNVILGTWHPTIKEGATIGGGTGSIRVFRLKCDMEVRLLRDTVRFRWKITNQDSVDHLIGIRNYMDTMLNGLCDGTKDLRNIVSIPGYPLIEDPTLLLGKDIPAVLEMFNSQQNPVQSIRFILKGQGATQPDVFGVDTWGAVVDPFWTYWFGGGAGSDFMTAWMYQPLGDRYIEDLSSGTFWKPRRVAPGASVSYTAYIGLACATSDLTKPNVDVPQYVASVQGPRTLKYTNEVTGAGELYPAPFTVHSWMMNTTKYTDFQNASFSLILPTGLTLDDSELGRYSKSVSDVPPGEEAHVTWKVKPDESNPRTGILDYSVALSASPVGGTTVKRQINIPATEVQRMSSGWQMISVPFDLIDSSPSSLGLTDAIFWKYDPYSRTYQSVTQLEPGKGYWLKLGSVQNTSMTVGNFSPKSWAGTQGEQIPLEAGWNLIGNPYLYTYTLGESKFYYRDYGTMSYDQAIQRGLISSTLFWWDPLFRQYKWSSDRSVQIKPWQGYWMKVLRSGVTMTVSPASQIGAAIGGAPTPEDTGSDAGGGITPPAGP